MARQIMAFHPSPGTVARTSVFRLLSENVSVFECADFYTGTRAEARD
jgi:hypothetical protein